MAIGRIGTYAIFQSTLKDLNNTQLNLFTLQTQISSGLKSQDYAGIAGQSEQFIDLENKIAKAGQYIQNNALTATRLEVTSTSLDQIIATTNVLKNLIITRRSGVQTDQATFQAQIEDQWQTIVSQLNATSEGRYLFSGKSTNVLPVNKETFPVLENSGIADDGYYNGSKEDITIRAEDNVEFVYNIRADDPAFQKIFAGLAMAKTGNDLNIDDDLEAAYNFVDQGLKEIITLQAKVNANKVSLDDINAQHKSLQLYWQGVKEDIGNTDLVAASTQVALNQGILQAAFQAFARINSLRLSDFLR